MEKEESTKSPSRTPKKNSPLNEADEKHLTPVKGSSSAIKEKEYTDSMAGNQKDLNIPQKSLGRRRSTDRSRDHSGDSIQVGQDEPQKITKKIKLSESSQSNDLNDIQMAIDEKNSHDSSIEIEVKAIKYNYKDVYEGDFKNNKRDGKGKYSFVDGSVYTGQFKDDKLEGRGIIT